MTHPDMIEGDAPVLTPDAARAAAWLTLEKKLEAVHAANESRALRFALLDYQAELVHFADRYWTDMRRAFGAKP